MKYVEVTDEYRRPYQDADLEWMIFGNGFGKVLRDLEHNPKDDISPVLPATPQYQVEWADGTTTVLHKDHLKESTRKAFFQARLSC